MLFQTFNDSALPAEAPDGQRSARTGLSEELLAVVALWPPHPTTRLAPDSTATPSHRT